MKKLNPREFIEYALTLNTDECVLWPSSIGTWGYGRIRVGSKVLGAHRVVCEREYGPPHPDRPCALHSCDTPACVNWKHLSWGSHQDNMDDMVKRGRGAKGEDHGRSNLTGEDAQEIKRLYKEGMLQREIAAEFRISQPQVSRIVTGAQWFCLK